MVPQGTVTHCNKSLLCLCTSSGTHTHNYHSKILDHFCCFIQQKQRCTRQRIRSKTHTSQLTVQLQPNHQCCLRYLCCTCPKTEFKEKHYRGQGQHPVQSSEALMGFPSQGTGGWFYLNDRSSRVHWYLPGSTARTMQQDSYYSFSTRCFSTSKFFTCIKIGCIPTSNISQLIQKAKHTHLYSSS